MRTTIKQTSPNEVLLTYKDEMGDMCHRSFMAPYGGGYVREWSGSGYRQVCARLSDRGNTLWLRAEGELLGVIRAEWTAYRRAVAA